MRKDEELRQIREQAKREGRAEMITQIEALLPKPFSSMHRGCAQILARDIQKVLDQMKEKK